VTSREEENRHKLPKPLIPSYKPIIIIIIIIIIINFRKYKCKSTIDLTLEIALYAPWKVTTEQLQQCIPHRYF
jgi:hypothetical protein